MKDKCPFCGTTKAENSKHYYLCGSWLNDPVIIDHRGSKCYERQLSYQTSLLREALEVVSYYTGKRARGLAPKIKAVLGEEEKE